MVGGRQTYFAAEWLDRTKYPDWDWLRSCDSKIHGYCTVCDSTFELSNKGKGNVRSHAGGKRHKEKVELKKQDGNALLTNFFTRRANVVQEPAAIPPNPVPIEDLEVEPAPRPQVNLPINKFLMKENIHKAEIRFTLATTSAHISDRSSEKLADCFPSMFPDSEIASKMKIHKDKHAYLVNHGLNT